MRKKSVAALKLALVCLLVLVCVVSSAATAAANIAPMTIRFGHAGPNDTTDQMQYGALAFAAKVNELSGGAMTVQVFPASQLGDTRTMIEMVQMGALHMGDFENAPMTGFVPETTWVDLPYIIRSYDHAYRIWQADSAVSQWIRPKFLERGIRVLGVAHAGMRHMMNNVRPITHPSDMEGLLIRVMESEVMMQTMNAFGATATPIPFAELYTALQLGTVDGNEQPFSFTISMRFYEVQRYYSLTGHFYLPRNYVFSEILWQQMTPEQQAVVDEAVGYTIARMNAFHFANQERLLQTIKDNGMVVNELGEEGMAAFWERGATVWPLFYSHIGSGDEARGREIVEMILSYAQ